MSIHGISFVREAAEEGEEGDEDEGEDEGGGEVEDGGEAEGGAEKAGGERPGGHTDGVDGLKDAHSGGLVLAGDTPNAEGHKQGHEHAAAESAGYLNGHQEGDGGDKGDGQQAESGQQGTKDNGGPVAEPAAEPDSDQ